MPHLLLAHFSALTTDDVANNLRKQLHLNQLVLVPDSSFCHRRESERPEDLSVYRQRERHVGFWTMLAKCLNVSLSFRRQLVDAGELDRFPAHDDLLCPRK